MYAGLTADGIRITGHGGDEIPAYLAEPHGDGPFPGVVVIHHMPGWDEATTEIANRFAAHGYLAIVPNLHHRDAPAATPDDAAAASRAAGGVPDERLVGDVAGRRGIPAARGRLERQGGCHRVLLGRAPGLPRRVLARRRRSGRLLRRLRRRPATRRDELQADPASRREPPLPAARPVRAGRPVPVSRAGRRTRGRVVRVSARRTSSTVTKGPATPSSTRRVTPTAPAAAADGWQRIFAFYGRYLAG